MPDVKTAAPPYLIAALAPAGQPAANGREPALVARDLWFSYDGRAHAVRGVDLAVPHGAMTMVLGRSGSGKTTLLKTLHGLLHPQRGSVTVGANGGGLRHRIAYVPQTLGLVRNTSALENALTGALARVGTVRSLLRLFPKSTVEQAKGTLASLGLGDKLNKQVYALSGGERQRVAIARALMQEPSVILADEFVSQLDPVTAEEILDMMRRIAADGVSFLITTHETDIVAKYADQVIVMREGAIVHDSRAAALTEAEMVDLLR
ncbi:MAG: ATP-binding cassette domain-containing protein [Dehalococcoidia bacterium]